MKKKIVALLAVICVVCCAIWLAACDTDNDVVEVESITLDRNEVTLVVGEYFTLVATITPSYANNQETEWTSSNTGVATVEYGSVTAIAEGEATITVTTDNGKTAKCVVTVIEAEPEPLEQYTVTLDANGGTFEGGALTRELQVYDGGKVPTVTVARGDKYVFTGWYRNIYNTLYKWDAENDTVNGDVTLYAGWKYLNSYQSVMDALTERVKAERQDENEAEILLIFTQDDCLCFVEKDSSGVFSYKTDISGFETVIDNAEIIAAIPTATLTEINNYNDVYTSDNNAYVADSLAYRFITDAANPNEAIVYSCVSEMEEDGNNHFTNNGPYYSCKIKAILAKDDGKVYDCSITVVAKVNSVEALINQALTKEFDEIATPLGDIANDFYAERIKEIEA